MEEITNYFNGCEVDQNFLVKFATSNKIKFKYENNNLDQILLYNEGKPKEANFVSKYSNGLILEKVEGKWRIVCYPLPAFENIYGSDLNEKIESYSVMPVYDATIVNRYWSEADQKWKFGTGKSFDISTQSWRGVSFGDMLSQFEFPDSDKNITYVYAVSDPRIHLCTEQAYCKLVATNNSETGDIECRDCLEIDPVEAYKNYRTSGYGYIFRGESHSYILESDKFRDISKILYKTSRHRNRQIMLRYAQHLNDMDYIICRAYFLFNMEASLYFPTFMPDFFKIRNIVGHFVNKIKSVILKETPPYDCPFNAEIMQFYENNKKNIMSLGRDRALKKKLFKYIMELKIIEIIFPILKNHRNGKYL
jgi:hypothetical protein